MYSRRMRSHTHTLVRDREDDGVTGTLPVIAGFLTFQEDAQYTFRGRLPLLLCNTH